jgi:MFS family permease
MIEKIRKTFTDYPRRFWILVGASFIDHIGSTMLFPFFSLYITHKFSVGMTEAGLLLASFSGFGLIGSMLGGALADKFGRKSMLIFGLLVSAFSSLTQGFANQLWVFFALSAFAGTLSSVGHPAQGAMVADLLPEEKRSEGFGILRVSSNLAWIVGPLVGGLVADRSFLALFITDAVLSTITAFIVLRSIPETRPAPKEGQPQPSMARTLLDYWKVAADGMFTAFVVVSILMLLVYQQMYSSLSVYLRDVHGISAQGYGGLMTSSAVLVVLAQFWLTRQVRGKPPMLIMVAGALLYMVGFSMFGLVSLYPLFVLAVLVITCGEMLVVPTGQSIAAGFAPEDMRGRYMAFFGLTWTMPSIIGPWAAGIILDNYNPNLVWYIGGALCALAAVGFLALHLFSRGRLVLSTSEDDKGPA